MEIDSAMEKLQNLQRDMIAFTESRLANLERLSTELDASIDDLKRLLEKRKRNDESRKTVNPVAADGAPKPETIKIEDEEYRVTEEFTQAVLQVSDELDLDELDAAKLCIEVGSETEGQPDTNMQYRALLRFHNQRYVLLDCVRLLLLQTIDLDAGDDLGAAFTEIARKVIRGQDGNGSAYWRRCLNGLTEIESYLKKVSDHRQTAIMTGLAMQGDMEDALLAQRLLLTRQHECLASVMSYLIRSGYVESAEFRLLISQAAALEGPVDIGLHYLPILISGAAYFGSDDATTQDTAKELHVVFAAGPAQQQWKMPALRAVTIMCWLVEYSSRFADPTNPQTLRVADRQKEQEERSTLLLDCVKDGALHYLLGACQFLKPEVWHDPAKLALVRFLLDEAPSFPADTTSASPDFATLMMTELQTFSDAFVTNMPDDLRRLQLDENERRRNYFSGPPEGSRHEEFNLERFLVIMSYAYQEDVDASQDFWSDRESNLYGFLTWMSKRLPTPRVAAFCELLRSIASDEKSGNQAHLFLLEDSTMTSGKLRKTYSVCWAQIFSELEIYASSIKNQPANPQQVSGQSNIEVEGSYIEPETYIMLEAYLRLASHICRISPDARNWILRGQTFHLGETLFQLTWTGDDPRVHASCFDLLSALLTDKVAEVNDGMWVLLDNWIFGGGRGGSSQPRPNRPSHPERQYLQSYAASPEAATGLVNLLNALVTPSRNNTELTSDALPFPENLGAANRHAGIDAYVDFVLGPVFRSTSLAISAGEDRVLIDVLRCACLQFAFICLSTFNEDLVGLANSANIAVDSVIKASSLAAYARLHPFARVMDWMFNNNVINALASTSEQDIDDLNAHDPGSPRVQATLRSVQVMNLAMKLQATYFDIVRPLITTQPSSRLPPVSNSALASYDEVILSQLQVVADIASFATSNYADLSLESLSLLQKLCGSRKLGEASHYEDGARVRLGSRLVGKLADSSNAIATEIQQCFQVFEWDLENGEQPLKLVKTKAVVDVLNSSLDTSGGRPSVAHALLGFVCHSRSVAVEPGSAFAQPQSLFHSLAAFAAQSPYAIEQSNTSWLLDVKRGASEVVLKLALSPLTLAIVQPELRAMEYLAASSQNQLLALANALWDDKPLLDPGLLLGSSALAVRDFLHVRENFFEYSALELRAASESGAFSVQEKLIGTLLGSIKFPNGDFEKTNSIFDLFDFFDLETSPPSDAVCKYLKDVDLSTCMKDDGEALMAFDVHMAEQLLILRKREMLNSGVLKEVSEEQQVEDEIRAILASLASQNNWRTISIARLEALEAWTDLTSLVVTCAGNPVAVALQGLQVVLPRFDKALSEDLDAAALLAKLTLTLVPGAAAAGSKSEAANGDNSSLVQERLFHAFRVCLKAVTDSSTGLALRDVCYRICCSVFTVITGVQAADAKQLLQLVQGAGSERLITVITEDAFSGRGVTRVSSLLFLDTLLSMAPTSKKTASIIRSLTKLNFVPVLIDASIGSVASSFQSENEELVTTVAYFHTALSLLLHLIQTSTEGAQLVLTSGFFPAVVESRLFSTDPDIGLDIDNSSALREFYRLLSAILRVVTSLVVVGRAAGNGAVLEQGRTFLKENRFSMQAVFKRTSAVQKTAGPPEAEARVVAEEFSKLLLVTDFLEDDEPAYARSVRTNGFS